LPFWFPPPLLQSKRTQVMRGGLVGDPPFRDWGVHPGKCPPEKRGLFPLWGSEKTGRNGSPLGWPLKDREKRGSRREGGNPAHPAFSPLDAKKKRRPPAGKSDCFLPGGKWGPRPPQKMRGLCWPGPGGRGDKSWKATRKKGGLFPNFEKINERGGNFLNQTWGDPSPRERERVPCTGKKGEGFGPKGEAPPPCRAGGFLGKKDAIVWEKGNKKKGAYPARGKNSPPTHVGENVQDTPKKKGKRSPPPIKGKKGGKNGMAA